MNRSEAEIFLKRFNGHSYHMWHDEPKEYKEYCGLHIPKKQENIWRLEKMEEYHQWMKTRPEYAEIWVRNIVEIMHALDKVNDELLQRLLEALEQISTQDIQKRILVMGTMGGDNDNHLDHSGYALYSGREKHYDRLHAVMERMMDISSDDRAEMDLLSSEGKIGWNDTYQHYLRAANRCEQIEKRLLSGEDLKEAAKRQKKEEKKKYNYIEKWLALDKK